jgi:hypothetical protein
MFRYLPGIAALGLLLVAVPSSSQTASLAQDLLRDWKAQRETMRKIADAMPAEKFGFRATPPERTYGEQVLHVAGANVMLLKYLGAKVALPFQTADADLGTFGLTMKTKAEILKALDDSYAFGEAAIAEFPEPALVESITGPRWIGQATRAKMVYYTLGHTQDIYGQMVVYLRLNGITPPASQRGGV